MQKKPDRDAGVLVKASKEMETGISQPPRGVGLLLKTAKAGKAAGDPSLPLLPMVLLLWMIADCILRGLNRKK